jgi:hypothetical protein
MATLAVAGSVHAAPPPPLPPGWTAASVLPTELPAPPRLHPSSRAALFEAFHPRRLSVDTQGIDVAALPLVELGKPIPKAVERDLWVTFPERARPEMKMAYGWVVPARVSVNDRVYGVMQGSDTQPILPRGGGGIDFGCGKSTQGETTLRWQTLKREADGALLYENATTIVHRPSCTARVSDYFAARAKPLIDGLLWGFRTTCANCSDETLHLILPPAGRRVGLPFQFFAVDEWIAHLELPLGPGRGAAIAIRVSPRRPKSWSALGIPKPALARPLVGAQVAHAVGAPSATLVVFAAEAPDT